MAAVGIVTLSLTDPVSSTARTIITQVALPVLQSGDAANSATLSTVALPTNSTSSVVLGERTQATPPASAECETLSLALGSVQLDLLGMTVLLDQINVDFIAPTTAQLGILLCGATNVIDSSVDPAERMKILNNLLDAIR